MDLKKLIRKIQFHKEILSKLENDLIRSNNSLASAYVTHIRSLKGFLAYLEKEFKGME